MPRIPSLLFFIIIPLYVLGVFVYGTMQGGEGACEDRVYSVSSTSDSLVDKTSVPCTK